MKRRAPNSCVSGACRTWCWDEDRLEGGGRARWGEWAARRRRDVEGRRQGQSGRRSGGRGETRARTGDVLAMAMAARAKVMGDEGGGTSLHDGLERWRVNDVGWGERWMRDGFKTHVCVQCS